MWKKLLLTSLTGILLSIGFKPAKANTVIENIAKTGVFNVGTPIDLVPYSYYNQDNQLTGLSIDLVKLIHQNLEKELGRKIELNFIEVTNLADAYPKMMTGEIDILCNTVFTWERDKYMDFTMRYTVSGIRLLFPKGKIPQDKTFANQKIGVSSQTFVKDVVKLAYPQASFVEISSMEDGMKALQQGEIIALAGDTVILDGLRQQIDKDGFEQFPSFEQPSLAQYGVACVVPENNSGFLNIANYTIAQMMEGYLVKDPEMGAIYQKWIGSNGVVDVFSEESIENFFRTNIMNHEQIPFPKK